MGAREGGKPKGEGAKERRDKGKGEAQEEARREEARQEEARKGEGEAKGERRRTRERHRKEGGGRVSVDGGEVDGVRWRANGPELAVNVGVQKQPALLSVGKTLASHQAREYGQNASIYCDQCNIYINSVEA